MVVMETLKYTCVPSFTSMHCMVCRFEKCRSSYRKNCLALFPVTTSSLLKLANHAMHGSETWYARVFQRFHDDHEQKMTLGTFPHNYFFTSQTCIPCIAWFASLRSEEVVTRKSSLGHFLVMVVMETMKYT